MLNSKSLILITSLVVTIFFGCEREWHFTITDLSNYNYPKFCISHSESCKGDGVSLASLNIDEVNNKGDLIKPVWTITAIGRKNLKNVVYGIAPEGYKENSKAVPLELNKLYSVQNSFYFQIVKIGEKVDVELYDYQEFNQKFKWPVSSKNE